MKKFLLFLLIFLIPSVNAGAFNVFDKRGKIVIIMYHKLSENSREWNDYCISPDAFEKDIEYIKRCGYEFMTASQLADENTKNRKIAVITFDDGYDSDCKYAVPILKKHAASATFFIYGDAVGTNGYMTEENIKEISSYDFVEIGNHSYKLHDNSSAQLSVLYGNRKNTAEIVDDYEKNSEFLKNIIGREISALSYPNGLFTTEVDKCLKTRGVKITFSTEPFSYVSVNTAVPVGRKTRSASSQIENLMR